MAHFALERRGSLLLAVAGAQPLLDEEFQRYLAQTLAVASDPGGGSVLMFTDGSSPTAAQRAQLKAPRRVQPIHVALVSDSSVVHALSDLLGFINLGTRVFTSRDWREAMAFAGVTGPEQDPLLAAARALAQGIGDVHVLRAIGP